MCEFSSSILELNVTIAFTAQPIVNTISKYSPYIHHISRVVFKARGFVSLGVIKSVGTGGLGGRCGQGGRGQVASWK